MKLTIRLPCHEDSTVEIDDCHTIANLKEMLNNGIYKSFVLSNFHHISPQFRPMPPPQVTRENKLFVDSTRYTPEFALETALDIPEPLFI